ncbi:MarR family winged helix-turn-helix transcriptional regulator [Actinomadura macra]|uniref:MarR family winged helix-turn-helix transcriptional regulator n=1 Tax=Actinomadura macra TaxID=46164 RepID=UPI0009FCE0D5|nr:MarR family transcriptional regulator [Actinomadura macra]
MTSRHPSADLVDLIVEQWGRERPDLDTGSIRVLGRLHRCDLRYQALVSEVLGRYNLTTAAFDVLASLRRSGPTYRRTAGELAQIGLITTGGLTQRIDRLVSAGLVRRTKDENDRRIVYIELTKKGHELIDRVVEIHFSAQERMLSALSRPERLQLGRLLARLEVSLEVFEHLRDEEEAHSGA